MASKRRYKIGINAEYDSRFDRGRMKSVILNATAREHDVSHSGSFDDKSWLQSMLLLWLGNSNGEYLNDRGILLPSKLKELRNKQSEIDQQFKRYQIGEVNQGNRKPTELPPEMMREQLLLFARFDVVTEEIELLKQYLDNFKEEKKQTVNKNILKHGPRGSGQLQGGVLIVLDGQRISVNRKGELYIDEPTSPYYNFLIPDYKEFVMRPWNRANGSLQSIRKALGYKYKNQQNGHWNESEEIKKAGYTDLFALEFNGRQIPDPVKIIAKHGLKITDHKAETSVTKVVRKTNVPISKQAKII